MEKKKNIYIIITIISIIVVAGLGSLFVALGMDWFNTLNTPSQWINNIVIPIVWTIIYISFGIILTIWIRKSFIPLDTIICLIINGLLNIIWCLVFFTLQLTLIGNIVIILNLIAGYILISKIFKANTIYGYILSIYPVWLSIATTLNLCLWILN